MILDRRSLLAAAPGLAAWPVPADEALSLFADYEREIGGRIGVYANNLKSGRKIVWRPDERFLMYSTFKASLAALALKRIDGGRDSLDAMIPYGAADIFEYAPIAMENIAKGVLSVAQMCAAAVEWSDNNLRQPALGAGRRSGRPHPVLAFDRRLGHAT